MPRVQRDPQHLENPKDFKPFFLVPCNCLKSYKRQDVLEILFTYRNIFIREFLSGLYDTHISDMISMQVGII